MTLVQAQSVRKGPTVQPAEDEELLYDANHGSEAAGKVDPKSLYIQLLYRPQEPIHEMTQDSIYAWLDHGSGLTRLKDPFGGWINTTRNWQTRLVLKNPQAKYVMLVDSDVGVPWPVPYMLMSHDLPVVSGVVPCYSDDRGGLFMNIACKDPHGTARFPSLKGTKTIPSKGLVECHNVGCGCLLIRRDVLEKLWEMYEDDNDFGQPFESPIEEQRKAGMIGCPPRGEDICFTDRVREAGFKVFADFEARCIHNKIFPLAWPEANIQDVAVDDWVTSVFDYKVRPV